MPLARSTPGIALLFVLSAHAPGAAAQPSRSAGDSVAQLLRAGVRARGEERAASVRRALGLWAQALALAEQRGDGAARSRAIHLRGEAFRALSEYDSAAASLEAALELRRAAGDRAGEGETLVELARVALATGRTPAAGVRAREALALARPKPGPGRRTPAARTSARARGRSGARVGVEAGAQTVLAQVLWLGGKPDSAYAAARRALALRRRRGDARGEGEALQVLGDVHRSVARRDSALADYQRALALQEREGDLRGQGYTLRVMGLVQSWRERRGLQRAYAQRAIDLFRQAGERRGAALVLLDVGRYHRRNGAADSSTAAIRTALAELRAIGDHWGEATAWGELALNLAQAGLPDSVAVYRRRAREGFRAAGDVGAELWVVASLGDMQFARYGPDSALAVYREGVALARRTGNLAMEAGLRESVALAFSYAAQPESARAAWAGALPVARRAGEGLTETSALMGLAGLQRAGPAGARAAVALYDTASWVLARMLVDVGGDRERLGLVSSSAGPWARWSLAWLAREGEVGSRRATLAALAAGERGRAQALLALMRTSGSSGRRPSPVPPPGADLAAEGQALADRARAGGSAVLVYQFSGDTLLTWLIPPAGDPLLFRTAVQGDTLAALVGGARALLGADDAPARGGGRRVPPLEAPTPAPRAYREGLGRLARLLLPGSLAARLPAGREVVIVPSGALNLVPFAALPLPDGEYLGARHPLRYAPSLAALAEAQARPPVPRAALAGALVVGDPAMPTVTTYTGEQLELDPLPAAGREADAVAARLGTRALHGAAAGERAVTARLSRAPLVHLATHGFAYAAQDQAQRSFVALAPGGGDDGLLTVAEVLSRPGGLRAELVVLSACQSGLGNLQDGEGTVGLQRAFLAMGARSVMVSLWSVSDRATEALMRGFYAHWLGDADHPAKAEALRRAQADVRATPGMESPLFWAAFQVAGAR